MVPPNLMHLLQEVTSLVSKLKGISPKHWKGNDAPKGHHWDAGSIVADAGLNLADQTFWVSFKFTDGGIAHEIKAVMPVTAPGTPGGGDVITLDGQVMQNADFVVGSRIGLDGSGFYHRVICEFKFNDSTGNKHDYRFDGDL